MQPLGKVAVGRGRDPPTQPKTSHMNKRSQGHAWGSCACVRTARQCQLDPSRGWECVWAVCICMVCMYVGSMHMLSDSRACKDMEMYVMEVSCLQPVFVCEEAQRHVVCVQEHGAQGCMCEHGLGVCGWARQGGAICVLCLCKGMGV